MDNKKDKIVLFRRANGQEIRIEDSADISIDDLLNNVMSFIRACGYHVYGELTFVAEDMYDYSGDKNEN